eukprot:1232036-Pleurochrysis_carterae.AAC.1
MSHGCGGSDGCNARDGHCETEGACGERHNRWSVAMPQPRSDARRVMVVMTVTNIYGKQAAPRCRTAAAG